MGTSNDGKSIYIYMDDQVAIENLISSTRKSRFVVLCKDAIKILSENRKVHIYWVQRYTGIEGNEIVGEQPRESALFEQYVILSLPVLFKASEASARSNLESYDEQHEMKVRHGKRSSTFELPTFKRHWQRSQNNYFK